MAWCRWGPEPYSYRLVFHHHIGPTRSDMSVYATMLGPQRRDSQVGSDALDVGVMPRSFPLGPSC
eukprot:3633609-Pyramimonas_sp.AAC.1